MYSSLEKLIELYPDKPWDWNNISRNNNISWDFVLTHLELPWNWTTLSMNTSISLQIILNNPNYPWNWGVISWRDDLTLDIVEKNMDKDFNMCGISKLKDITIDFILSYYTKEKENNIPYIKKLNWYSISTNPSITWDIVQAYPNLPWLSTGFSANPNITIDIIDNNPNIDFDYFYLTSNSNITWDYIYKNIDKGWNWYEISLKKVNWEIVEKNPNLPWKWIGLSQNLNISVDIIIENKNRDWDWSKIITNRVLTLEQSEKISSIIPAFYKHVTFYNTLKYKKEGLSQEYLEKIEDYIYETCNIWEQLSSNPYLDWTFVVKNIDKNWAWRVISWNLFSGERNERVRIKNQKIKNILSDDQRLYKDLIGIIEKFL